MIKKITLAVVVLLVGIQFVPMEKNESGTTDFAMSNDYQVPDHVTTLLQGACNDCHSNSTPTPGTARFNRLAFGSITTPTMAKDI